ncbi:hypothetical protein [Microbacterium sp. MYb66]|uniref:hypothetical protein n=1 Tax=Microbacterium sp. MYb66 TaxID=1848692 RepID=UPI000D0102CB|nr:hypothetical protein [Microbacterium sp. MYb66]PRA80068.1 hypothetical protein CQ045_13495 [Microbacterium sp. MYb66]
MISGTQTQHDGRATPDDNSPGRTERPAERPPCEVTAARIATCGFDAVKVTNEEGHPLTITDLAQFAPSPTTTTAEPSNAGVAGMPSNFVAPASVQTRSGDLFGRPVAVRFTPAGFDFDYGDGTSATTRSGGQTWAALGQAPFTPTPTSHSYRGRGIYAAHVTVRYTAEVDIGGGWFPISGELSIVGAAQQIRIFEAHTALVARTCAEQPAAPGC